MRKIILHSPTVDRHGKWHDAGSELTVGADDNADTDLTTTRADELIDSLRAVTATTAAAEETLASVAPPAPAAARKTKA